MTSWGGTSDPTVPWWQDWNLNYMPDVYSPIYGGHAVQIAMFNTLRKWLPVYVREFNRQLGGDILQIVKEYGRPAEERSWSSGEDTQIDCIVPGTMEKPRNTNETGISSCWKAELNVFVYAGTDWQETLALTYAYAAAARAAIVQHPSLEGFAQTTNWTGESFFRGPEVGTRWSGIATVDFEVNVFSTVDRYAGPPDPLYAAEGTPTEPTLLPIPNFPEVTGSSVEIENQTLSSEEPTPI